MARTPMNQKELVKEKLQDHAVNRMTSMTETLVPPGIATMHLKETVEVAEFLANIIKSRRNVTQLVYNIGTSIQVTSESDLSI